MHYNRAPPGGEEIYELRRKKLISVLIRRVAPQIIQIMASIKKKKKKKQEKTEDTVCLDSQ